MKPPKLSRTVKSHHHSLWDASQPHSHCPACTLCPCCLRPKLEVLKLLFAHHPQLFKSTFHRDWPRGIRADSPPMVYRTPALRQTKKTPAFKVMNLLNLLYVVTGAANVLTITSFSQVSSGRKSKNWIEGKCTSYQQRPLQLMLVKLTP